MSLNRKEVRPNYPNRILKMDTRIDTRANCTPAIKELLDLRIKTKILADKAYDEAHRYQIRRMYFTAEVKGNLRAHPVGIPWLNEPDSYAAKQFLDKAKGICDEQVIGNVPQHTNKLKEVARLSQQYYEIFSDLNRMTDWTVRVATQLESLKDTLADPWCLLTSPAPLQGTLQPLYTFEKKARMGRDGIPWSPEVIYEPWKSKSLSKAWPNSRLKIDRNPTKVQPDSCQPLGFLDKEDSEVRSQSRKPSEAYTNYRVQRKNCQLPKFVELPRVRSQSRKSIQTGEDNEVQSNNCESPSLPKRMFPRKSYAEILTMINQDGS